MTSDTNDLINGYLDDTLSPTSLAELQNWLYASPQNVKQFALATLIHDRLRSEHLSPREFCDAASSIDGSFPTSTTETATTPVQRRQSPHYFRSTTAVFGGILVASLLLFFFWGGWAGQSAAAFELDRIIHSISQTVDRTFQIRVEEATTPVRAPGTRPRPEETRPPKPPMDDAVLYVRGGGQFVLSRKTVDGQLFVTGCNGQNSWAVRPDGPVRCSSDLDRFNRDVPGHEHSMPLINMEEGLERLRAAYELQLLPVEMSDDQAELRLLVAVRKPKERGPRRVEITYAVSSGLIQQMRFVDMPYGPDRLTLRMTLVDERSLGPKFFDHNSHHDPEREVRFE